MKTLVGTILAVYLSLSVVGCRGAGSAEAEAIKSTSAGDITVTISSGSGELRSGDNELILSFVDASGTRVNIEAASLTFHMPAMGSMPEMNNGAVLTTTSTAGRFQARVNIEMAGTWEARVDFEGPEGVQQARMTVNAR